MDRRTLLKSAGVLTAGGAVVGTGLFAGSVGASTTDNFTISDASPITTTDGSVGYVTVTADHKVVWTGFNTAVAAVAYTDVLEVNGETFTIYDNTPGGSHDGPVRLADYSTKDNQGDGWGGPGEYASEDPSSYVAATGPAQEGFVHATIDWNVLTNDQNTAKSVENPGDISLAGLEPANDGESKTTTLTYKKTVTFYKDDGSGNLVAMTTDDGALPSATSTATFDVTVEDEASTTTSSGDGTSESGTATPTPTPTS